VQPGIHNENSARVIVPLLIQYFHPTSVVDVGCGTGDFLSVFKRMGVETIKGIDGKWSNRKLLFQNINESEFQEMDLEFPEIIPKKFDLAVCLEVAEHLRPTCAEGFIKALTTYSDVIVFSAAIPDQGGFNHLNEQWPLYWENIFSKFKFIKFDLIRPKIWNDKSVKFWYRQNIFIYMKETASLNLDHKENKDIYLERLIHPDLYEYKSQFLDTILEGRHPLKGYLKMIFKLLKNKILQL
jgi:SAM-dependent methyltransferase